MKYDMLETFKMSLFLNNQNNIFSTIIIIIFFSLFNIDHFNEVIEYTTIFIQKIFLKQQTNHVILEGINTVKSGEYVSRVDNLFSDRFKAIWIYINSNNNNSIYSIKEFSMLSNKYYNDDSYSNNDLSNIDNENFFIVNQKKNFTITNGIYCSVKFFNNNIKQSDNNKCNINIENIYIDIFSYKYDTQYISKFIDNITNEYITKVQNIRKNKLFIYTLKGKSNNRDNYRKDIRYLWDECEFKTTRNFSNLFFDNKINLIDKIEFFNNNKSWYEHNGHPYTLGIGLYGPPGTGKTSVIKCIANMLKRHLIVIPLSKISTQSEFSEYYFEKTYNENNYKDSISFDKKIIVLEDIDCMTDIVKNRKSIEQESISNDSLSDDENDLSDNINTKKIIKKLNKKKSYDVLNIIDKNNDKITLSYLLNIIDGIRETPGRILIITSNHYNKLDNALVRPGRIDIKLEMKNASINTISQMYCHYYNEVLDTEFIEKLVDNKISPATITNIYLNSKNKENFKQQILENIL
jgi:hypothetical protein